MPWLEVSIVSVQYSTRSSLVFTPATDRARNDALLTSGKDHKAYTVGELAIHCEKCVEDVEGQTRDLIRKAGGCPIKVARTGS
jgi:hypothetical protein